MTGMTGIATIGEKIVETLYSNRVTSETYESTPLPCPLHSKLGCFLFSKGSSNSGTTLHGGDGGGVSQLILSPIVEGPGKQGCSVWTPFLTKWIKERIDNRARRATSHNVKA